QCHVLDLRIDQEYRRSEPVNSEEGAPMGIGIWYEMWISDPIAYLFKNTDPRGSLRANVSNATVRCLSNMPLAEMLETRHTMSQNTLGQALREIAQEPVVAAALFEILEVQKLLASQARLRFLPPSPWSKQANIQLLVE